MRRLAWLRISWRDFQVLSGGPKNVVHESLHAANAGCVAHEPKLQKNFEDLGIAVH